MVELIEAGLVVIAVFMSVGELMLVSDGRKDPSPVPVYVLQHSEAFEYTSIWAIDLHPIKLKITIR